MKLIALRPLYINGTVVTQGEEFDTNERHGRELLHKAYVKPALSQQAALQTETSPVKKRSKND